MNFIEKEIAKAKRRRTLKKGAVILLLIILGGLALVGILSLTSTYTGSADIAVIRIEGTVVSGTVQSGGYIGSEHIGSQIRRAADDPLTRAIVLRIDSGGGTPAASQEIVRDIIYAKQKKPVVASMGDIATSGAYYIAAYADRIYSSPDTVTGGIGVIWFFYDTSRQLEEEGIEIDVVKSGDKKDMTSPYRTLSPEEEEYAQEYVDSAFSRFYGDISSQRNISRESIEDGRVIRGEEAISLGLVDEFGNLHDAIAGARMLARGR